MAIDKKTNERAQVKRRPFGVPVQRLGVSKDIPGYHLRWVNDEPGRVEQALESGYQFVDPEEVGKVAREDNKVRELVGVARDDRNPLYAYLMKIPEEFYLEDRAVLENQNKSIENAIKSGKLNSQSGDGRYVPEGGISYKTK